MVFEIFYGTLRVLFKFVFHFQNDKNYRWVEHATEVDRTEFGIFENQYFWL